MLSEKTIGDDSIEVLADGAIQVREARIVLRDGVADAGYPPAYHRYVLQPGAGLAGRTERIVAVAQAVWTEEVLTAWRERQADIAGLIS